MPKILPTLLIFFFAGLPLQAADDRLPNKPAESTDSRATIYAQNLESTISIIVDEYVRPVSREELTFAGRRNVHARFL